LVDASNNVGDEVHRKMAHAPAWLEKLTVLTTFEICQCIGSDSAMNKSAYIDVVAKELKWEGGSLSTNIAV